MKKIVLLTLSFLFLALISPRTTFAAKFNLDPLTRGIKVGEEFDVKIGLDTQGKEVNSVEAKLSFDKNLIEVIRVSFSGIFPANDQNINNNSGYVQISSNMEAGATSFNGNSNWGTLTLKGRAKSSAELRFSCPDSGIYEVVNNSLINILDCSSLTAGNYTISEESQPEPTATPTPESGGGGGQPSGCTDSSPDTPTNLGAASGPNNGEVTLTWTKVSADYYSVFFGGASGAYEYGAANIGNTNQYIVRQLSPGKLYYFAIAAVRGCASSGFSNEASARARGATGGTPAKVTPKASPKPTPTPPYQPIGEILPEVNFPTEEEMVTPTPIPIFEPKEGKPSLLRTILLILVFLGVLTGLGFGLWKLIKGKMPPPPTKIVIPEGPTPTEPSAPPAQA
jgi:hypothetical protein